MHAAELVYTWIGWDPTRLGFRYEVNAHAHFRTAKDVIAPDALNIVNVFICLSPIYKHMDLETTVTSRFYAFMNYFQNYSVPFVVVIHPQWGSFV